jgi:hypothetical protein
MLSPVDGTIQIRTRSGAIGQELLFQIVDGELSANSEATNCVVHFSLPPSKWWDDVRFTCSSIQVFGSKEEPDDWVSHPRIEQYTGKSDPPSATVVGFGKGL